jgi:hypothetical protein
LTALHRAITRALFLAMLAGCWIGSTSAWLYLRSICP